jgi:hypothetical protein
MANKNGAEAGSNHEPIQLVFVDDEGHEVPQPDIHDDAVPFMVAALLARVDAAWEGGAFRPLSEFVDEGFSLKRLETLLKNYPIRRERPTPRRTNVHAGDMAQAKRLAGRSLSRPDGLITRAYVSEVEARKAEALRRKRAGN